MVMSNTANRLMTARETRVSMRSPNRVYRRSFGRCSPLGKTFIEAKEFRVCIQGFSGESAQVGRTSIIDYFGGHALNAPPQTAVARNRLDQSEGTGQGGSPGGPAIRKCTMGAQSAGT